MKKGVVYLIGAGPGDPGLITLKGKEILESCDALVYDHLASKEFLSWVPSRCKTFYVGKQAGCHSMKQDQINELLVQLALEGNKVVRLKGGDSFVFGRGSEEILALKEKEIPWELVPGITSCVSVPELAGIPVTHRNVSRSFHVITGHTLKGAQSEAELALYGACEGTLVFLMGLSNLEHIAKGLIKGGKSPDTPAAVIEDGSLASQRTVRGTLETIYEKSLKAGLKTPAIIVVGETAAFDLRSEEMTGDKIDDKPLSGLTVGITGTSSFTARLETALKSQGAKTLPVMKMEVVPEAFSEEFSEDPDSSNPNSSLTAILKQNFTWLVFTSVNGVESFFDRFLNQENGDLRLLCSLHFAVIGEATRQALKAHGFQADLMPKEYCSQSLAEALINVLTPSDHVLLARSKDGSVNLSKELEKQDIFYKDLALYHVKGKPLADGTLLSQCSHLVFGSASGAKAFLKHFQIPAGVKVIAIGPVTGKALREAGVIPYMTGNSYDIPGILKGLTEEKTR